MAAIEAKLETLGHPLPAASTPAGSYVPVAQSGNLLFVSGQIPMGPNGIEFQGKLGAGMALEDAQAAARLCALNILAQVKAHIGDLDNVSRIVRVGGFVNSTPDFPDHPKVVNGASEFFMAVFGDSGKHARAAVGVANLPFGVAVEVDAIVEVTG